MLTSHAPSRPRACVSGKRPNVAPPTGRQPHNFRWGRGFEPGIATSETSVSRRPVISRDGFVGHDRPFLARTLLT
jgi:hypothetical protein